ncbi:glycosyltransferase [Taibaiella lutea]|uniref:glycosyltransferase n=1 Tax=Taibaiella lutea TaxID=2608001 RepID=UPI001C118198|nr:glycosyltransferase [Taibaiella lutea]
MKILIAPLDWGLGHTTRCIPLIQYFISEGHEVYAAAETASAQLLRENFPALPVFPLKGYRIFYSSNKATFSLKIAQQIPKILSAISAEQKWLQQIQEEQKFDLIISDNRYGLYHKDVPSVILTHQLQIQSGINQRMDNWVMKLHMRLIQKFNACWIVDEESNDGYSGKLAHPERLPKDSAYIGLLSQFSDCEIDYNKAKKNNILILLSGPEPMRSMFESRLIAQARNLPEYEFVIVGGNPLGERVTGLPDFIKYYTHLNAANLLIEMEAAGLVICRSGYSTIMDLALLQKKALLIPTPGQSEQEYLSRFLIQKGAFHTVAENLLNLKSDIMKAFESGPAKKPIPFVENMKKVIEPFMKKIKS